MASKTKVDLSEFFRLSTPKKPPCRIGFACDQFQGAEREQLIAALDTDKGIITAGAIRKWLSSRDHDVSISAISSHRNGNCTCGKDS